MKKILQFLVLIPMLSFSQGNSIKTTVYSVPTTDGINVVGAGQVSDEMKNVTIRHLDGFGRPMQIVKHKQSQSGNDVITAIEYGILGQKEKEYLPFASPSSSLTYTDNATVITNTETYYANTFDDGRNPYYRVRYEKSPFGRALEKSSPGSDWYMEDNQDNDHTIKISYRFNDQSTYESVKVFKSTSTWETSSQTYTTQLTNSGTSYYSPDQLYTKVIRNENWTAGKLNSTVEYKNSKGQLVLSRTFIDDDVNVDTYYVYDQFDNLTFVIPPAANGTITEEVLNNLCYQYLYDHRRRQVMKKLPGKQWQYIVYDVLNRQVAIGPSNSPFGNNEHQGWLVTKYDIFGRIAYTGWFEQKTITKADRLVYLQQLGTNLWETRSAEIYIDEVLAGYTKNIYPQDLKLLTVTYYDDYDFPSAPETPENIEHQHVSLNVKGLQTGKWVRILTTPLSTKNKLSSIYYDEKGRIIRINALRTDTNGYTQINNNLDFSGKINYNTTRHKYSENVDEIYVEDQFRYDNQQRLQLHSHKIGQNGTEQLLSLNTYNDFGQLINKKTGNADLSGSGAYQSINYKYTIRGWLKSINDPDEFLTDHFFALKLNYNTTEDVANEYTGEKLYNGNISEAYWRTSTDNVERKYGYFYDDLDRIKDAIYQKKVDPLTTLVTHSYNERLDYDLNGNIKSIHRNGYLDADNGTTVMIDRLNYEYFQNSNQLESVEDATGFVAGFHDGNSGSPDYKFDENGNLSMDENKEISSITYNHLNLPLRIDFKDTNFIEYQYDALGIKLKEEVKIGARRRITEYRDGFHYKGGILQFFPTSEGYVSVAMMNGSPIYSYVFNYKDHLGNIRVSYADVKELKIIQENHYYPFGLKHENYNAQTYEIVTTGNGYEIVLEQVERPEYQYKYNGQEWQDELDLNMTAMDFRQYDNALGRFVCIDPLAELDYNISPYAFARNNPIIYADPTGLCPECEDAMEKAGIEASEGDIFITTLEIQYTFDGKGWIRTDVENELDGIEIIVYSQDPDKFGRLDSEWYDFDIDINNKDFNRWKNAVSTTLAKVSTVTSVAENVMEKQIIDLYRNGGDAIEALTDYKSLDPLRKGNKLLQKVGYIGLAIDGIQYASKVRAGTVQNSDTVRLAINAVLTGIAISNPIGLIAVGAYAVFDAYYGDQFWKATGIDN